MKKNTKIVIGVIIGIAALGMLFILGRPRESASGLDASLAASVGESSLEAGEQSFDFGTISMAQGVVSHAFTVKNVTANPVALARLTTSCMCTTATFTAGGKTVGPFGMPGHGFTPPLRETLGANEEATVTVTFDPAAHGQAGVGLIEREIYLESKEAASVVIRVSATVTP